MCEVKEKEEETRRRRRREIFDDGKKIETHHINNWLLSGQLAALVSLWHPF